MKSSLVISTIATLLLCQVSTLLAFTTIGSSRCPSFLATKSSQLPSCSTTQRFMFSGSGAEPEEDEEKQAQLEQAAKSMGFSVKEYQLVLKMQENLAEAVNSLRVTGGKTDAVKVELDGNSPAGHIVVTVTEEGKALGKAQLEKSLVEAFKEATDAAKKGQQAAIQAMNQDIAGELKQMEGLK